MARSIDADALLEAVKAFSCEPHRDPILGAFHKSECRNFLEMILKAPTMKTDSIVYCHECKFFGKHPTSDKVMLCNNPDWNTEYTPFTTPDGFCHRGIRRDDGE